MSTGERLALAVALLVSIAIIATEIHSGNEYAHWKSVCYSELKSASASDSLRIYRLQPKCLP